MTDAKKMRAVFLMGPTASGKTEFSLALADALRARGAGAEIICVDSAQVYRGMDIGSAKPTAQERARAPHHLLDICDPAERFSAAQFVDQATGLIAAIRARGKVPLLVGGSMLYFRALEGGLSDLPRANEAVRRSIAARAQSKGWGALHSELARVDPLTAQRLHPNDSQRIARALEVFEISGQPMSRLHNAMGKSGKRGQFLKLLLMPEPRALLHERIALRLKQMFSKGFVEEVEALHARGDLHEQMPSIRSVGYRQVWEFVAGRSNLIDAQRKALEATRQFAKRQITWIRSEHEICKLGADSEKNEGSALNFEPQRWVNKAHEQVEQWMKQSSC